MIISLTRIRSADRHPARALPLSAYLTVWQERRELARMSPERLRDLGISPADAAIEATRSFWDLPDMQQR